MPVFKILGGHGRVALLLARELSRIPGNRVFSLVRDESQFPDVTAMGAEPQLFDIEHATVGDFVAALNGAEFVVWSAGAGGKGGPARTYAVDRDGAIRSMQASREVVGVTRFVMVSYLGSRRAPHLNPSHPLYHYGQAKHEADNYLRESSGLNYTIVNPGYLTNERPSGRVDLYVQAGNTEGRSISRANVAKIIATLLTDDMAYCQTEGKEIDCLDGDTPILEGLRTFEKNNVSY